MGLFKSHFEIKSLLIPEVSHSRHDLQNKNLSTGGILNFILEGVHYDNELAQCSAAVIANMCCKR